METWTLNSYITLAFDHYTKAEVFKQGHFKTGPARKLCFCFFKGQGKAKTTMLSPGSSCCYGWKGGIDIPIIALASDRCKEPCGCTIGLSKPQNKWKMWSQPTSRLWSWNWTNSTPPLHPWQRYNPGDCVTALALPGELTKVPKLPRSLGTVVLRPLPTFTQE